LFFGFNAVAISVDIGAGPIDASGPLSRLA
jgi:hypothetical protein